MVGDGWKEIAEDVERWADQTLADGSHADRT